MDLAELLAFLVQFGGALATPDAAWPDSVVILPVESGGTNWEQVAVQVGGAAAATLTAGLLAVWWARKNHKDALTHDREMRVKDDVRDLLVSSQEAMFETLDALRILISIQPARVATQLEAIRGAQPDPKTGDIVPFSRGDFYRSQMVDKHDGAFDAAVRVMHMRLNGLRLYPLDGPLIRSYHECAVAMRSTVNSLREAPADPEDHSPALKEAEEVRRQEIRRTRQVAHDCAERFSAATRAYVKGESGP